MRPRIRTGRRYQRSDGQTSDDTGHRLRAHITEDAAAGRQAAQDESDVFESLKSID